MVSQEMELGGGDTNDTTGISLLSTNQCELSQGGATGLLKSEKNLLDAKETPSNAPIKVIPATAAPIAPLGPPDRAYIEFKTDVTQLKADSNPVHAAILPATTGARTFMQVIIPSIL
ncbi:hypothetical protein RhiLY_04278 [Ceratobasidium sp. AG-Ba]|nr:hypothetical protein RhiLY_04278 [Ceratobasidium sp. AG-Ba]